MSNIQSLYSHAATILPVKDVARAMAFYTEKLQFELTFKWEDPPSYAVLKANDQIQIHLSGYGDLAEGRRPGGLFVFVHDVDALYAHYLEQEVIIHAPLGNRQYQMRDFDILDPDGNLLTFGQGI